MNFWNKVTNFINIYFNRNIKLTKYYVMLGFPSNMHIANHILLIAKRFIYNSTLKQCKLSFDRFATIIEDICKIEEFIARKNNRLIQFDKKWKRLRDTLKPS